MGYVCMVSYVVISTFPLIFLHQIFYKSAIVTEINMHQMVLGLPETSLPFCGSFLHFWFSVYSLIKREILYISN